MGAEKKATFAGSSAGDANTTQQFEKQTKTAQRQKQFRLIISNPIDGNMAQFHKPIFFSIAQNALQATSALNAALALTLQVLGLLGWQGWRGSATQIATRA